VKGFAVMQKLRERLLPEWGLEEPCFYFFVTTANQYSRHLYMRQTRDQNWREHRLSEYDDLLEELKRKVDAFRQTTAKEYIPNMYRALRNQYPSLSPQDARKRIERDCFGIWEERTILDALPDEAKDLKKQKAGRLRQKKANSAAVAAAQLTEKKVKVMIDTEGKSIDNSIPQPITTLMSFNDPPSPSADNHNQLQNNDDLLNFEFSIPFQKVLDYLFPLICGKESGAYPILFTGVLDMRTRQVISPTIGKTSSE